MSDDKYSFPVLHIWHDLCNSDRSSCDNFPGPCFFAPNVTRSGGRSLSLLELDNFDPVESSCRALPLHHGDDIFFFLLVLTASPDVRPRESCGGGTSSSCEGGEGEMWRIIALHCHSQSILLMSIVQAQLGFISIIWSLILESWVGHNRLCIGVSSWKFPQGEMNMKCVGKE